MKKLIEIQYGTRKIKILAYIRKDWAIYRHLNFKNGDWVVCHLPTQNRLPHFFPDKKSAFAAAKLARRAFDGASTSTSFYKACDTWFDEMAAAGFRFIFPYWELAS